MEQNVKRFNKMLRNTVNFEDLGFKSFKVNNIDFSWELHRKIGHKTDKIDYGFSKDKWGDDLILLTIDARLIFESVNKILMSVPNKGSYNFYLSDPTIIRLPNFDLEVDKYVPKLRNLLFVKNRVVNERVFVEALDLFQEQLQTNVLPFFDKIQTLQQVNDEILEKYDWKEWSNYISGLNGVHYFKSIIILKLCNSYKYHEFTTMYSSLVLDAMNKGRIELKDLYDTLINLLDYLESGKYLEIDDTTEIEIVIEEAKKTKRQIPILPINTEVEAVFSECQVAFKELGIYLDKKFTLNDYRNDATWQSWEMETPDKINWVYFLLLFSGTNVYNHNIDEYQPVSPNVYYFDSEWDGFVSYKEIMERLNLLTGSKLPFSNIENKEEGTCTFEYKDESYEWKFELNDYWTDPEIFERFVSLVSADIEKTYYIMLEGQGGIIVYYNKDEHQRFENYFNVKLVRL